MDTDEEQKYCASPQLILLGKDKREVRIAK